MSILGLTKQEKLLTKADFDRVFAKPQKKSTAQFVGLMRKNKLSWARLGVIISKRQVKTAVGRNRIRRVVRESFRHHKHDLKGVDIVVLLRSECSLLDKCALRCAIDDLWQKLIASL